MKIEQNEKRIALINPETNARVEINLEAGGLLLRYDVQVSDELINVVKVPFSAQFPIENNPYHPSAYLTPWVNRIRNGNYSFEGRNYQLPINEPKLGNAIHGLLARKRFRCTAYESTENEAFVQIGYAYTGEEKAYPFPFTFSISYRFEKAGGLLVNFNAENTGKGNMPFACGWHPYFGFPSTKLEDLTIHFHSRLRYLSDSQMIPLQEEAFERTETIDLGKEKLDHVFLLHPAEKHVTELHDTTRGISLFIQQSSVLFPYLVVFAPDEQDAVAIEPMTANTDAFNTAEGLQILKPGTHFDAEVYLWAGKPKKAVK
jgi:aldose 1-epimerase